MRQSQPQLFADPRDWEGATFSACRRYRYTLNRVWNPDLPRIVFVMLNPSTADEHVNDPTVERCQRRAGRLGFGAMGVVNLFAFRSTNPAALYECDEPVGPDNDAAILGQARQAEMVVCAWGTHGALNERGRRVREMLTAGGVGLHALSLNADGSPGHPLYLSYGRAPVPWTE